MDAALRAECRSALGRAGNGNGREFLALVRMEADDGPAGARVPAAHTRCALGDNPHGLATGIVRAWSLDVSSRHDPRNVSGRPGRTAALTVVGNTNRIEMGDDEAAEQPQPRRWVLWLRWIVGVGTAFVGATAAAWLTWVGHCSSFGGRCPADPEPLWENDVFGTVWMIVAATVAVVTLCMRPDRRGAVVGVVRGVVLGLVVGLLAVAYTSG